MSLKGFLVTKNIKYTMLDFHWLLAEFTDRYKKIPNNSPFNYHPISKRKGAPLNKSNSIHHHQFPSSVHKQNSLILLHLVHVPHLFLFLACNFLFSSSTTPSPSIIKQLPSTPLSHNPPFPLTLQFLHQSTEHLNYTSA